MGVNIVTFSSSGGAGNVANTLREGFLQHGIDAVIHTAIDSNLRSQPLGFPTATAAASVDNYLLKRKSWPSLVSYKRDQLSLVKNDFSDSNLVIFRWMNGILGEKFLDEYSGPRPVWGLADMNPFTGVCHYSGECQGFKNDCASCPALRGPFKHLASRNLSNKSEVLDRIDPRFVAPTDWILGESASSSLLRGRELHKILNPLSERFFSVSREGKAPNSKRLKLLINAANLDDPTKGVWNVLPQLKSAINSGNFEFQLVGLASRRLRSELNGANFYGQVPNSEILSILHNTQALLVPSLFENAGTVVAEAASQGVPSIARRVGGMPEMTNHGDTGFLFDSSKELGTLLSSLTASELEEKGRLAKEWSQGLRPKQICQIYIDKFL